MKQIFACEICNKTFDNKVDCKLHENEHKKVAWQHVCLRHENGKWIFDYSQPSQPQYKENLTHCHIATNFDMDFPISCPSECSADKLESARCRLKKHAISWYKKRIEELEMLKTHQE